LAGAFDGKVALVTGGGSGIGRASSLAFAREGASVAVADVAVEGGEETVRLISDAGGKATFVRTDVSKNSDVAALIERVVATYGRLDCAHNNAGVLGGLARIDEYPEADFDRIIAINLKGVWLCLKHELPVMVKQGGGAIVNTASSAGLVAMPMLSAYVASKHGVAGITKAAALECARRNVRVNAVCPGYIDTPMTSPVPQVDTDPGPLVPVRRLGTPEEVAAAVVWLCSDAASYVTGALLSVDGAMTAQ
jgi:NAD(P)-dependent dehydrogenase (short-subunit alcohol dehydrogenase family)